MKRFKFKLETVHKLRERKVDEQIRKLSIVVGHINKLNNDISENSRLMQEANRNFIKDIGFDINYLRVYDGYIKGLTRQNEYLQKAIEEQDSVLLEAKTRVIEARKEAEIIEIIKRKRLKEFNDRILRAEKAEEDDGNSKDYTLDRRRLRHEDVMEKDNKPVQESILDKQDDRIKAPKSGYDLLKDYYESFPKK
jgi:flagellar export protein FliJ